MASNDALFDFDAKGVDDLYNRHPWTTDHYHFKNCNISALASMKMLKHALNGVARGRATVGFPVEVMGLLIGRPSGNTIIVTDVAPLPIEGEAAFVTAGDKVMEYQTILMESLDKGRKDIFVGWYHSHPFEVGSHPMYFLSNTDLQTQTASQMGLPTWTAIVIDPQRSVAKGFPELGVFRVLKPGVPDAKTTPDGEVPSSNEAAELRWHSWKRYYALKHNIFMSTLGNSFLKIMSRKSLWIRALASQNVMETDFREGVPRRITNAVRELQKNSGSSRSQRGGSGKQQEDPYSGAARSCCELAAEQCIGHTCTIAKQVIFNAATMAAQRRQEKSQSSNDR